MQNRTVLKLFGLIAPLFTWLFTMFLPGRKPAVHKTECVNKCRIMQLVQSLTGYVDPQGKTPLTQVLERCYALGAFPALWAVEGVGKDLAEFEIAKGGNPKGLLDAPELGAKWDKAPMSRAPITGSPDSTTRSTRTTTCWRVACSCSP